MPEPMRSYAADPANRVNPANGICLCRFCHDAFDAGQLLLASDGSIELVGVDDPVDHVAKVYFQSVEPTTRKVWLGRERHVVVGTMSRRPEGGRG